VPDLGGWRRERLPNLTNDEAYFTLPPDWVCEVLSPSSMGRDRVRKLPIYAEFGVRHVWLVDPLQRTLEVLTLSGNRYVLAGLFEGDAAIRAEPFDAIELNLGILWEDVVLGNTITSP
jgi:Uma2 family endonuclease